MSQAIARSAFGQRMRTAVAAGLLLVAGSAATAQETLYQRLGGMYPIAATVDDLVERLYVNGTLNANPVVAKIHANTISKHGFKVMVSNWVAQATGGPKIYTGLPMDKAHAHLNLTDREFDVVMNECATTFYKFNVPKKEMDELMALLQSYRSQVVSKK